MVREGIDYSPSSLRGIGHSIKYFAVTEVDHRQSHLIVEWFRGRQNHKLSLAHLTGCHISHLRIVRLHCFQRIVSRQFVSHHRRATKSFSVNSVVLYLSNMRNK